MVSLVDAPGRLGSGGAPVVDLRVLLLGGPDDDPTTRAWRSELERLGVLHDVLSPAPEEPLRAGDLMIGPDHGLYNAVVLATDSSSFWPSLPALAEYRRRFQVRQVNGFEYPRQSQGLGEAEGRALDGERASLTQVGRRHFPYLTGVVPIEAGSFGYLTREVDRRLFMPCLQTAAGEPLVGVFTAEDGLEDMVVTVNYDDPMLHWRLLARGLLAWVTRGCHLGLGRSYLACHVDDVLLPNVKAPDGAPPEEIAAADVVRMTAQDVATVVSWQRQHRFTLDLAYNGYGGDTSGADALTNALLEHRHQFRWINHTWSHLHLGRVPGAAGSPPRWQDVTTLCEEIGRNRAWAQEVDIPVSPTSLVTGAHSGLDSPNMPEALERCRITAIASDASRLAERASVGPAVAVPRHPTNVFTHVSTWPELLGSYNQRYAGVAPAVETPQDFLDAENRIVLRHMLGNDPRPIFAHQSNLTDDRLILRLLEHAMDRYRTYLADNTPLVNLSMDDIAEELRRRARWHAVRHAGQVSASLQDGAVVIVCGVDVEVPLTLPPDSSIGRRWLRRVPFGEAYAGTSSAWCALRAGEALRIEPPAGEMASR